jgi:hypothetical protein
LAGEQGDGEEADCGDGGDACGEAVHVVEEVEGVGDDQDPEQCEGVAGPGAACDAIEHGEHAGLREDESGEADAREDGEFEEGAEGFAVVDEA